MHRDILSAIQALRATKRKRLWQLPRHPLVEEIQFQRPLASFILRMRHPRIDYQIGIDIEKLKRALRPAGYSIHKVGREHFEIKHGKGYVGEIDVAEILGMETPIIIRVSEPHVEQLVTKIFAPTTMQRIAKVRKLPKPKL